MPRIDDQFADATFFIYPSREAAEQGIGIGGCGFVVGVPCPIHKGHVFTYAVTNRHNITKAKQKASLSMTVSVNLLNGGKEYFDIPIDKWVYNSTDDVAISFVRYKSNQEIQTKPIHLNMFLTEQLVKTHNIGIGDDIFLVGRHARYEGTHTNIPMTRTGCISLMPNAECLRHPETDDCQASFIVETKTISGYSGAPVFVRILPYNIRNYQKTPVEVLKQYRAYFLGIHWGHLDTDLTIIEGSSTTSHEKAMNSGLGCVVPAWKVQALLQQPELKNIIDEHVAKNTKSMVADSTTS